MKEDNLTIRVYTRTKVEDSEITKLFTEEHIDLSRVFGPIEIPPDDAPSEGYNYYYIIKLLPHAQAES